MLDFNSVEAQFTSYSQKSLAINLGWASIRAKRTECGKFNQNHPFAT